MAALPVVNPTIDGPVVSPLQATSSDTFRNPRGNAMLLVENGSGASINVTLVRRQTSRPAGDGTEALTLSNVVVAVGAGVTKLIGPVPSSFVDGDGNTTVNFSATGSTITAVAIQPA